MHEDRIKKMAGKYWMYKTNNVLVEAVKISDNKISIILEKDVIQYDHSKAKDVFEDFLPTSQSAVVRQQKETLPVTYVVSSEMPDLTQTLKDSITKLKTNRDYIPQAIAINKSINTLVNLAKLELITNSLKP